MNEGVYVWVHLSHFQATPSFYLIAMEKNLGVTWKCVRVCVCVRTCVHVCVHEFVCAYMRSCVRVCMHACVHLWATSDASYLTDTLILL